MIEEKTTSIMSQAMVFERYGARLDTSELAELLKLERGTVLNQISAGRFPIPTYVEGGRRWADFRDVAGYLDQKKREARSATHPD